MNLAIDDAIARLRDYGDEQSMRSVAESAQEADVAQLARLADVLARSGEVLSPVSSEAVDIASSGGPGSLSTLLPPLFVRALGREVRKIAVPGRPAGGIDTLATLAGYQAVVNAGAARHIIGTAGYLHVAAGSTFCPLDASFFIWRQNNGAQAIPNLAIASLLAKKVAAGVARVVLDVRVGPHGNFGSSLESAREYASRFVSVARELDISAACTLSDAPPPAQPWVGRGEALVAIGSVLRGHDEGALRRHAEDCISMALLALRRQEPVDSLSDTAREVHETMLVAHGASPTEYWARVDAVSRAQRMPLLADADGCVQLDIGGIRSVLVGRQAATSPRAGASYSDPCGIRFMIEPGATVESGQPLAEVRDEEAVDELLDELAQYITVRAEADSRPRSHAMEIVDG